MHIDKNDVTFTPSYKRGNNCPFHLFTIPYQITESEAAKLQEDLGYHPAGYGMYKFSATEYNTSWECYNNCE
jgi:hypothetical protein